MELTNEAAVITVGAIHGGVRTNIIPEEVEMIGTIRSLDPKMQDQLHEKLRRTAEMIAASAGATATVEIVKNTPITYNHEALTAHILPTLQTVAGQQNVVFTKAVTGAEDFAYYQQKVPGVFVFVGGMAKGQDPSKMPAHHTPDFMIDESGLKLGVRTLAYLAVDYLNNPLKKGL
jgi:metal-dependent amidase/aminoacylase/carboxypeptidase family protein